MKRLLGIVLLVGLTGCGGGGEADIPYIEDMIASSYHDQTGQEVSVDCPDQIDWETGGDFHCFAEDDAGQGVQITVSMENDAGEWTWAMG